MKNRAKIQDVFTPRRAEVNPDMYVSRPDHERALRRSVHGSLHTVISGESGSGKSWLYKKVATDEGWLLFSGNFANAARDGSVADEIFNAIVPAGDRIYVEQTEKIDAKLKVPFAEGGGSSDRKYQIKGTERLEYALSVAARLAGERTAVLVIDNLEAIFRNSSRMEELGNIILLLDDERYAKFNVKILLVGVPANLVEYYQKIENLEPIANRIEEIPHMKSLTLEQLETLVSRGFNDQLLAQIPTSTLHQWSRHINRATLGIAQRVHEYCEKLAYELEDNRWMIPENALVKANNAYMDTSLYQSYAVVEKCMNERETKAGRRNQVIYALGGTEGTWFDASEIEILVREEFPSSTHGITLGIGQILAELTTEDRPLLKRKAKGNSYRFSDPKYLMCLRLMLVKDSESERVVKLQLKR